MKGIILAGGIGSRLAPATNALSKQLIPIYDKPMIYYSLSVLMLADVREILIITTPQDVHLYQRLLSDGSHLGLALSYELQAEPRGLAEAFVIGENHIGQDSVALVLGDNLFHGPRFSNLLREKVRALTGAVLFGYPVSDPHRYGICEIDKSGRLVSIVEKPKKTSSNLAVTGLYFYNNDVIEIAKTLAPSSRGELEITDININYLKNGTAQIVDLGRGFAWLDAGTHQSLLEASQYVHMLEQRQGVRIGCVEEIALEMGFIGPEQCFELGMALSGSEYGRYIMHVADRVSVGR